MRRKSKILERLTGKGEIVNGEDIIARVYYDLTVTQLFVSIDTPISSELVADRTTISGRLRALEGFLIFQDTSPKTLRLNDGRIMEFVITAGDPINGYRIANANLLESLPKARFS